MSKILLRLFLFILAVAFCHAGWAQNRAADSLQRLIKKTKIDSTRILLMLERAQTLLQANDSAGGLRALDEAISFAATTKEEKRYLKAINSKGFIYENFGNLTEAEKTYNIALQEARKRGSDLYMNRAYENLYFVVKGRDRTLGGQYLDSAVLYARRQPNKEYLAIALTNRGGTLVFEARYEEATQDLLEAMLLCKALKDTVRLSVANNNMGNCLNLMRQYKKAQGYLETAVELAEKKGDARRYLESVNNLVSTHYYLKNYEKAIALSTEAIEIYKQTQASEQAYGNILMNLAICYKEKKDYAAALRVTTEAEQVQAKTKGFNYYGLLANKAELYALLNQFKQCADQSMALLADSALEDYPLVKLTTLQNAAACQEKLGNGKLAYALLEKAFNMRDSLNKLDINVKVADLESKYQLAQRQVKIKELDAEVARKDATLAQQRTLGISGGVVAALLIVGGVLYNRSRQREKELAYAQQMAHLQSEANRSVLEAELNERRRIAAELHDGVAQIFSAVKLNMAAVKDQVHDATAQPVLQQTITLLDEGCQELRTVSHTMMPEVLLKKGLANALTDLVAKLHNGPTIYLSTNGLTGGMEQTEEIMLYRIVQELLTNTLKHAQASSVDVQLFHDEGRLHLLYEDNGRGFDTSKSAEGIGLGNIQKRVAMLGGTVTLDSTPGKGMHVSIVV